MLRIAGGVILGLAVVALLYVLVVAIKNRFAAEEADNPGALIVVLIVITGSIAAYFITTEVLGQVL